MQISYGTYQLWDAEKIVDLWNRSLPKDRITPKIWEKKVLCDPNFRAENLFVASAGRNLVGALLCIMRHTPLDGVDLEPTNAWITAFFVDPKWQRQGIGTSLMERAFQVCQEHGRTNIFFSSYAPNYFLPGIDGENYPRGKAFLETMGFKRQYSPVAMDKSLLFFTYPDDVAAVEQQRVSEGFSFQALETRFVPSLLRFASDEFNPDWGRALRDALIHDLPHEQIILAVREDKVVGFCMYGGYDRVKERFGPFGVSPSVRGQGIGKVLLYRCLAQMSAEGLHNAWFLWTGEQLPAGKLYHRAGFVTTRRFDVMKREL